MKSVGSYEAKTRLPELLREVEEGERFAITRHGTVVAHLVPPEGPAASTREGVLSALRTFGSGRTLGPGLSVRDLVEAGRE